MPEAPTVLAVSLLATLFVAGCWDVWAVAEGTPQLTVSNLIGEWSAQFPVLPLSIGVLLGHLFWPRRPYPLP